MANIEDRASTARMEIEKMKSVELKPCPFCGGEARLKHGLPYQQRKDMMQAFVQCHNCGCRTILFKKAWDEEREDLDKYAVDAWNRRAGDD